MSQLNRRNALALVVAGLPAMAVPAVAIAAVAPDPIFAAIDAHKRALATFHAYCDGHESDDDEAGRLSDIYCDAARDMLRTVPTTLAGAVTLLRYLIDCENGGQEIMRLFMDDERDQYRNHHYGYGALLSSLASSLSNLDAVAT